MNLGLRFKRYRNLAGLTQKEAAELIGINSYQLGNYETNRSEPSIKILKGMSKAYNVSIDVLVGNDFQSREKKRMEVDNTELLQLIQNFVDYCNSKEEK